MMQDLAEHPFEGEISYRANQQAFKALGYQKAYDAAVQSDHNMCYKPIDLLDETIHCQDGPSGHITEYNVVDCGTSMDVQGVKRHVSADELHDMRICRPFNKAATGRSPPLTAHQPLSLPNHNTCHNLP
ncbi:hypothetical protein BGW80DRAFT_1448270 [Lactifluus volemus]|nr:hypothetical protein BGW80DRAFT_1448270 [Lactifluus volemus]